jgi:hypothetical protein
MKKSDLTVSGVYQVLPISITFPTSSGYDLDPFSERYTKWRKSLPPKGFDWFRKLSRSCPSAKFDPAHIEEVVHNGLVGIFDSYFAEEPTYNMEFYFDSPLVGLFSSPVVGSLFCLEVIGCACFVSEISNPSRLENEHNDDESEVILEQFQEYVAETKLQLQKALQESYIPLKSPIFARKFEVNQLASDSKGLLWTPQSVGGYFYKIFSWQSFCRSVTPSTTSPVVFETDRKVEKEKKKEKERILECILAKRYTDAVEDPECEQWSMACAYSMYIYRVYSIYSKLVIDVKGLVPARLMNRKLTALVESQFVGDRNAEMEDITEENMTVLTDAIIWLAKHRLLYIDFRLPNIRVDSETEEVWLIDYDDCVILDEPLCCGSQVVKRLAQNRTGLERLEFFYEVRLGRELSRDYCDECLKKINSKYASVPAQKPFVPSTDSSLRNHFDGFELLGKSQQSYLIKEYLFKHSKTKLDSKNV